MIILEKAEDALIATDVVNVDVAPAKNLRVNGARKRIRGNLNVRWKEFHFTNTTITNSIRIKEHIYEEYLNELLVFILESNDDDDYECSYLQMSSRTRLRNEG